MYNLCFLNSKRLILCHKYNNYLKSRGILPILKAKGIVNWKNVYCHSFLHNTEHIY